MRMPQNAWQNHRCGWFASALNMGSIRTTSFRRKPVAITSCLVCWLRWQRLKNDFTVFSDLDHPGITGGHQSTHTFLSGIRSDQAKQFPEGNVTVDQRAAEFVGAETRYQSMQLGLGGGGVSWTRNGVEIPTITRLQTMFDALFLETPQSKRKRQAGAFAVNRSILDVVGEDAAALKKRISLGDSTKLEEYFTSIREVEKRLEQSEAWLNKPKPTSNYKLPAPLPTSFTEEVALFYDLMKLALQTDSTRVISMAIHGWTGDSGLSGVTKGYHDLSHHGRDDTKLQQLGVIEQFHTSQLARFLDSLKRSQVADDASLLDRTMVLMGSGLGNASSHSNRNYLCCWPVVAFSTANTRRTRQMEAARRLPAICICRCCSVLVWKPIASEPARERLRG